MPDTLIHSPFTPCSNYLNLNVNRYSIFIMHFYSFYALISILASPVLCIPNPQPPTITELALVPLVDRDLDTTQDISWSKKNEILFNT